jgi:hypothetical protein
MIHSQNVFVHVSMMIALLLSTASLAQNKVTVLIEATIGDKGADNVGQQVVFELKEAIRGSQSFRLTEDDGYWPRITVVAITTALHDGTAISYSYLYDSEKMPLRGAYITSTVQYCPRNDAPACARNILAVIDQAVERLGRRAPELRQSLFKRPSSK